MLAQLDKAKVRRQELEHKLREAEKAYKREVRHREDLAYQVKVRCCTCGVLRVPGGRGVWWTMADVVDHWWGKAYKHEVRHREGIAYRYLVKVRPLVLRAPGRGLGVWVLGGDTGGFGKYFDA